MANILIVSDSPQLNDEVASYLPADVTVTTCLSARDALQTVRASDIDVVIADMQIGSMGGPALCSEIRLDQSVNPSATPSLLLLLDRRADVFLARRTQVNGWVLKPLDPVRVRRAVTQLIDGETYQFLQEV